MRFFDSLRFLRALLLIALTLVATLILAVGYVLTKQTAPVEGLLAAILALLVGAVVLVMPLVLLAGYRYHRASSAELRANEERFRSTFEQAAVGIAHVAPNGDFLRINDRFCEIVGYTRDEMLARTFQDITHPDDLDADFEYAQQLLRGEADVYSISKRYFRKDGEIVWVDLTVSLLRDGTGDPRWFVSVVDDITALKKAEEAKAQLDHDIGERLKELGCLYTIFDSIRTRESLDGIFQDVVNAIPPGWHYPEITRGKVRFNENEWASEPFEETAWMQSGDIVVNGKNRGSVEVYYLEECPTLDEGPFMREERQLIDSISRTLSETIERRLSHEELRKSEAQYRALVDQSMVGVFTTSLDGRLTFANQALVRMYDFETVEQMTREGSLSRWSDPKQRERMLAELQQRGSVTTFEAETTTHTGRHIHVLLSAKLEGDRILGMVMDITERHLSEKKLREYQQRLTSLASQLTLAEERERRAIASDLHDHVAGALTLTRLQLAGVRSDLPAGDRMDGQLDEISQTMLQAVRDTRSLIFELSSPSLRELGMGPAIEEWMKDQVEEKHGLSVQVIDNAQDIQLDDDHNAILFRSVRELLTNVVKHARATSVSVRLEKDDGEMWVTIQDDGLGFDPGSLSPGGRAFGLFSIQERMGDLGGEFEVESRPGAGCTAVLRVPIQPL